MHAATLPRSTLEEAHPPAKAAREGGRDKAAREEGGEVQRGNNER